MTALRNILCLLCVLACTACASHSDDFLNSATGYESEGKTGGNIGSPD